MTATKRFINLRCTVQKMKFSIKDFFIKCDLVTFTEEILNGKLHFLCNVGFFYSWQNDSENSIPEVGKHVLLFFPNKYD